MSGYYRNKKPKFGDRELTSIAALGRNRKRPFGRMARVVSRLKPGPQLSYQKSQALLHCSSTSHVSGLQVGNRVRQRICLLAATQLAF